MTNQDLQNKKEKIDELLVKKNWDKNYWNKKISIKDCKNIFACESNLEDTELEIEALKLLRDNIENYLKKEINR